MVVKTLENSIEEEDTFKEYREAYNNPARGRKDANLMLNLGGEIFKRRPAIARDYPNGDYFLRKVNGIPAVNESEPNAFIEGVIGDARRKTHNYVDKNLDYMINRFLRLNPEILYSFALGIKPRKTGYGWHDKVVKIYNELMKMQSFLGNGKEGREGRPADIEGMERYILKNVIKGDMSTFQLYRIIVHNDPFRIKEIFKYCLTDKMKDLRKLFLNPADNLDGSIVKRYVRNTLYDIRYKEGKGSKELDEVYHRLARGLHELEKNPKAVFWRGQSLN